MSSFVSSLGNNNSIPKVLLPMILYTHMKLDPESILNKEQEEQAEQIPINNDYQFDFYNGKNENNLNESDNESDNESVTGSGIEDLD